jgi:hypothetical protein
MFLAVCARLSSADSYQIRSIHGCAGVQCTADALFGGVPVFKAAQGYSLQIKHLSLSYKACSQLSTRLSSAGRDNRGAAGLGGGWLARGWMVPAGCLFFDQCKDVLCESIT